MANPTKPDIDYSYSGFQASQGNNSFPGAQIDNDLAELKRAADETIDFVTQVIREDGKLNNGIVTKNALAEDILLGVPAPRPWVSGTVYAVDQTVTINNAIYICATAHTAGTFATELGAGFWALLIEFTVPVSVDDNAVTTVKLAAGAVTTPKVADGAITGPKVAANSLDATKFAASVATIQVGMSFDWDGLFAPSGYLFKFGQEVSRTTYAALFAVLCPTFTANLTSGSNTISGLVVDLRNFGLEGTVAEGTGIPAGTTITTVNISSIVLSNSVTATNTAVQVRIFPHGAGDGSSTFNVPDDRDRATIGRGNMGGTAAGRISTTDPGAPNVNTSRLGASGGVDRHTLTTAQMPAHGHTATASSVVTDPGHAHTLAVPDTTYALNVASIAQRGTATSITTNTAAVANAVNSAATGVTVATTVTVNSQGGGEAHPNVQPSRVVNRIIFTGV